MKFDCYALDVNTIKGFLQEQEVFASLSTEMILKVCEDIIFTSFDKNECLIKEGQDSAFLHIIINGSVDVKSYGVKVASCTSGCMVGEVSASGLSVATADVVASSKVDVISLPLVAIQKVAEEIPAFAQSLYDTAMSRLLG